MKLLERIENIENILIQKFGTLDLEVLKKKDAAFFKEATERLANINKGLDENDALLAEMRKGDKKLDEALERLQETKINLKVGESKEEE